MGISGLLPLLKSIHRPCNLKKFAGQTIGVDAYGWLHRGAVACAIDLALGKATTKFVEFSMNRVRMLVHFGVIPYMVFDGDYLPSKSSTERERAAKREESKKVGLELYRLGKLSQAHLELQKAVDVTPEMAGRLIEELKKIGVQFLVAPYEADAQLAYLERKGVINGILSEDSDLLVFGAKRLLTKLDQYGDCVEINRNDFTACREISLIGWSDADFRRMAILSGCDYLQSINKMGLKTAYRLVRKYKTIEKIISMLRFDGQYHIPAGYLDSFRRAEMTFLHQRVFCPSTKTIVTTTDLGAHLQPDDFAFIGDKIEPEIAIGIAEGRVHPMTKTPLRLERKAKINSSTPRVGLQSRTADTAFESKSAKPIDFFFLKRTPLAELDPNVFTPSPSQRRLMQRHSRSWQSLPALPIIASSESNEMRQSLTRNAPANWDGRRVSVDGASSLPHPPKRARLCSALEDSGLVQDQLCTTVNMSRFFTSPCSSSSTIRGRNDKKMTKQDIHVWSDESIDDIMIGIPDISEAPELPQALEPLKSSIIFDDAKSSKSLGHSQSRVCMSVSNSSESLGRVHKTERLPTADRGFAHQSMRQSGEKADNLEFLSQRPHARGRTSASGTKSQLGRGGNATSLQRLGIDAISRSLSHGENSHPECATLKSDRNGSQPVVDNLRSCKTPPKPRLRVPPESAIAPKGSEDLIFPSSEGEESARSSVESLGEVKQKLDLGKYTFAG